MATSLAAAGSLHASGAAARAAVESLGSPRLRTVEAAGAALKQLALSSHTAGVVLTLSDATQELARRGVWPPLLSYPGTLASFIADSPSLSVHLEGDRVQYGAGARGLAAPPFVPTGVGFGLAPSDRVRQQGGGVDALSPMLATPRVVPTFGYAASAQPEAAVAAAAAQGRRPYLTTPAMTVVAPASGTLARAGASPAAVWECGMCTTLNPGGFLVCEVCGAMRDFHMEADVDDGGLSGAMDAAQLGGRGGGGGGAAFAEDGDNEGGEGEWTAARWVHSGVAQRAWMAAGASEGSGSHTPTHHPTTPHEGGSHPPITNKAIRTALVAFIKADPAGTPHLADVGHMLRARGLWPPPAELWSGGLALFLETVFADRMEVTRGGPNNGTAMVSLRRGGGGSSGAGSGASASVVLRDGVASSSSGGGGGEDSVAPKALRPAHILAAIKTIVRNYGGSVHLAQIGEHLHHQNLWPPAGEEPGYRILTFIERYGSSGGVTLTHSASAIFVGLTGSAAAGSARSSAAPSPAGPASSPSHHSAVGGGGGGFGGGVIRVTRPAPPPSSLAPSSSAAPIPRVTAVSAPPMPSSASEELSSPVAVYATVARLYEQHGLELTLTKVGDELRRARQWPPAGEPPAIKLLAYVKKFPDYYAVELRGAGTYYITPVEQ